VQQLFEVLDLAAEAMGLGVGEQVQDGCSTSAAGEKLPVW
jgi:hypothetical protein